MMDGTKPSSHMNMILVSSLVVVKDPKLPFFGGIGIPHSTMYKNYYVESCTIT